MNKKINISALFYVFLLLEISCAPEGSLQSQAQCFIGIPLTKGEGVVDAISFNPPDRRLFEYFVEMNIGGQKLLAVADTGSSDLILTPPDKCGNFCSARTYDPKNSKTAVDQKLAISVGYGSGDGNANIHSDNVGFSCGPSIDNIKFGLLTNNNNLPNILGLSYEGLSRPGLQPFFKQMVQSSKTLKHIVNMTLCGERKGSRMVFGARDPGVPKDSMHYFEIIRDPKNITQIRYTIFVDKISIDDSDTNLLSRSTPILVDSGTTFNIFPQTVYDAVVKEMLQSNNKLSIGVPEDFFQGRKRYSITPEQIAKFPTIQLSFKDIDGMPQTYNIPPQQYFVTDPANGRKVFGIRSSLENGGSGSPILGQAFMEGYSVEFNQETDQIGIGSNTTICQ